MRYVDLRDQGQGKEMSLGQPSKKQSILLIMFALFCSLLYNMKLSVELKVVFCVLGFLELFGFFVIFGFLDEEIGKLELKKGSR